MKKNIKICTAIICVIIAVLLLVNVQERTGTDNETAADSAKAEQDTGAIAPMLNEEMEQLRSKVACIQYQEKEKDTYEEAMHLLYTRDFSGAKALFDTIPQYKDSKEMSKLCVEYPETEPEAGMTIIDEENLLQEYENGKTYLLGYNAYDKYTGMVYVPDEITDNTVFVQYYSGGDNPGDDYLYRTGVDYYCENYHPDAVIVFTNESGTSRIYWRIEQQYAILRQLAAECGTILHNVSAIGSSNGCYTAMKMAAVFYTDYGIELQKVGTLDTGLYWKEYYYELTEEEAKAIAEAGTEFYLFEDSEFIYNFNESALRIVLDSGIETYAVMCQHGNHDGMSRNAYTLGVFDFISSGKQGDWEKYLPTYEYEVFAIDGSTDPSELSQLSWTFRPEGDTRILY